MKHYGIEITAEIGTDHSYNGITIDSTAAGENLAIGDVAYLKSDSLFWKMDADAEATTKGMCVMATETINAGTNGTYLLCGFIRDDSWTWTEGAELYVSLTPGNPTSTRPSVTGDIVRIIGHAYASNIIFFNPDGTYVEIA